MYMRTDWYVHILFFRGVVFWWIRIATGIRNKNAISQMPEMKFKGARARAYVCVCMRVRQLSYFCVEKKPFQTDTVFRFSRTDIKNM